MEINSQSFRDVIVWQQDHAFSLAADRPAELFSRPEMFALPAQPRRSAASTPANFVAGFRKRPTPDKLKFHAIAPGSADGCRYHPILAHDLGCTGTTALPASLAEVAHLLQVCIIALKRNVS